MVLGRLSSRDVEDPPNARCGHVHKCQTGDRVPCEEQLIEEEPLLIRVQGRPYSVVMRTPGEEIFHVAGFCLGEGLVDKPGDIATIGYCDQPGANLATVTLTPSRRAKAARLLERRGFVSQTSCGICGKELVEDLCQVLAPATETTRIPTNQATACVQQLPRHQVLYQKTGGSHGAMLFDSHLLPLAWAEDVGRHNALDKAIGRAFMEGRLSSAFLAVLSSRVSYELVQKAARARLEMVIGMSRPTSLAVHLAGRLNMTLACMDKRGCLRVFCGKERIVEEQYDR